MQWVDSPAVTPDSIARGVAQMTPGGGQEIHFDSSHQRAQFANGGGQALDVTDPGYVPQFAAPPSAGTLAETLPPDVLEAMAKSQPLTPEQIQALSRNAPVQRALPLTVFPPNFATQTPDQVELTIPVGNMTARVTFSGQPSAKHWRRLIRHLEIEADPETEEADNHEREEQRIAAEKHLAKIREELAREADGSARDIRAVPGSSESELPRPVKRRKRKNVDATAEPGELGGDNGSRARTKG